MQEVEQPTPLTVASWGQVIKLHPVLERGFPPLRCYGVNFESTRSLLACDMLSTHVFPASAGTVNFLWSECGLVSVPPSKGDLAC